MHFLCLEPRETDKIVLKFTKKFGPEISLLAHGNPGYDVRGDYQKCSVLYCVLQLCTVI